VSQNPLNVFVGAFVEQLAASGVREVCLCPGARSTPLALLLRRHPGLRVWVHLDERCAGFFALGVARASGRPAAVLTTSGTAAANLLPAVTECHHGRVPMIVLTADRPHELRDIGALQTIDQVGLYGSRVRWAVDLPLPETGDQAVRHARTVACRAVERSTGLPAGPVHLNFPFREPLSPSWQGLSRPDAPQVASARGRPVLGGGELRSLADRLTGSERPLVVCGPQHDTGLPAAVTGLAEAIGAPVLADLLSQVRCGSHHRPHIMDAYDTVLRTPTAIGREPDLIVRLGALPVSKPLQQYLTRHCGVDQVLVEPADGWADPLHVAQQVVRSDPVELCRGLAELVEPGSSDPGWLECWRDTDRRARRAATRELRRVKSLCEPRIALELADLLPSGSAVFAGNSMPVRDLDALFPGRDWPLAFLANRGASGIDGVVSSALGADAVRSGPLVLVLGDLSLYHDLNGLLAARRFGLGATIIVVNNDGGGVFSFLPQAQTAPHFDELFGTPHGLDFRTAAELYGLSYVRPASWPRFRSAVARSIAGPGVGLIEVRTDRAANAEIHRDLWAAVAAEIADD
jgi:2-succinyl-5-enolpyruvyl-6-hydroxy-3-cyclohexene-1-carboxylate synthase